MHPISPWEEFLKILLISCPGTRRIVSRTEDQERLVSTLVPYFFSVCVGFTSEIKGKGRSRGRLPSVKMVPPTKNGIHRPTTFMSSGASPCRPRR